MVPLHTKKNNCWIQRTLDARIEAGNKVNPGSVPTDFLSCNDPVTVCKYLRYFVLKARSHDGTKYSLATVRSILSGLNRILKKSKAPFNILDKQSPCFRELHLTLDCVTSTLHREGIGVIKNSAGAISFEDEELFCTSEVLGYHFPKALQ